MTGRTFNAQQSKALVAQLKRSRIFRDYEKAFRAATGLPIALRPIEAFDLPHHGDPKESAFCALMAKSSHACSGCLELQKQVAEAGCLQSKTLECFAGLADSAVPIRVGETLVGFLQTGQVLLHPPLKIKFDRAMRRLKEWDADVDGPSLEAAYFKTRVITAEQYDSILRLLTIFGQHLAALSNQLLVQGESCGPVALEKARALITERHAEELSLAGVARAVNMSAFYFCKSFKKATGMTFTTFLARVRVEKVKTLLLNPQKRVSEIAYEVGFQSLSQFNRVFRRIAGEAPSRYRERLPALKPERSMPLSAAKSGSGS
jgi:AraC-like DNA-binding protein/ligand-binding sensor protein